MTTFLSNKIDDSASVKLANENTQKISFYFDGQAPMLEITPNHFLVRGKPVAVNEKEAGEVYSAFHQWLTLAILKSSQ